MMRVVGCAVLVDAFTLRPELNGTHKNFFSPEYGTLSSIFVPRVRGVSLIGIRIGTRSPFWCAEPGLDLGARAVHWRFPREAGFQVNPAIGVTLVFQATREVRVSRVAYWYWPRIERERDPFRRPLF